MMRLIFATGLGLLAQLSTSAQQIPMPQPPGPLVGESVVEGTVTDRITGKLLSGALVQLNWSGTPVQMTTDREGKFRFERLPAVRALVMVRTGVGGFHTEDVQLGDRDTKTLAIRMRSLGAIAGTVVNEFEEPISSCTVIAVPEDLHRSRFGGYPAEVDDEGAFFLGQLSPGVYRLKASCRAQLPQRRPLSRWTGPPTTQEIYSTIWYPDSATKSQAQSIEVAEGSNIANIRFRLRAVSAMRIQLNLDRSRTPGCDISPDLYVGIGIEDRVDEVPMNRTPGSSDSGGAFIAERIPEGRYQVRGFGSGPDGRVCATIDFPLEVRKGQPLNVTVPVIPPVAAKGVVVQWDVPPQVNQPLGHVSLYPVDQKYGEIRLDIRGDNTVADFAIAPGRYRLGSGHVHTTTGARWGSAVASGGIFEVKESMPGNLVISMSSKPTTVRIEITAAESPGSRKTWRASVAPSSLDVPLSTATLHPPEGRPPDIVVPAAVGESLAWVVDEELAGLVDDDIVRALATPVTVEAGKEVTVKIKPITAEQIREFRQRNRQ